MMIALEKKLYTAIATAKGGRKGQAETDDRRLKVKLSTPKELGGDGGSGSNPEQLFAAGYAACFIGALQHVAAAEGITLPDNLSITNGVAIGPIPKGFGIAVNMQVNLHGLERDIAEKLVTSAHEVCPYSNATRGNIDVDISVAV